MASRISKWMIECEHPFRILAHIHVGKVDVPIIVRHQRLHKFSAIARGLVPPIGQESFGSEHPGKRISQKFSVTGHFKLTHSGSNEIDPSLSRELLTF
jgi:hypothetical protein